MSKKGKNKKGLNRRDFLKMSGGMMGLAIISKPIVDVFRKVDTNTVNKESDTGKDPSKVNQWCMVIDLRKCEAARICLSSMPMRSWILRKSSDPALPGYPSSRKISIMSSAF